MWSRVTPLLDKPAISINTDRRCEIPKRFHCLGTMKSEAKIVLDDKMIPYAQSVSEKVEEVTVWCAPVLDEKLHLCIDFTRLNKTVKKGVLLVA